MSTAEKTDEQQLVAVIGLSQEQATDLLFHMDEAPVGEQIERIDSRQLGDFGVGALVFVATLAAITGILRWVGKQDANVSVKCKFFKMVEIEIEKKTTENDIKMFAEKNAIKLK